MIAQPPIQFDRATGVLEGANAWERLAAGALWAGTKVSSTFSYRGYNRCANLLRKALPQRDIAIRLNPDAVFAFPYGDGYWSKLLDRSFHYENEIELLFRGCVDVDYVMVDCGANYGYWSVLASSAPFGAHQVIAIEPSSVNFARLADNARLNGDRFAILNCAIGAVPGTAWLSGTKHEAFSIVGDSAAGGEQVQVVSLDSLLEQGKLPAGGKYIVKLDVEGVEIEAIKGGRSLLQGDAMILCEEHGSDANHTVSRFILTQTALKLYVYDPTTGRFEAVDSFAILDRIKVASNVGYNVFGTASPFWDERINSLNANASRRVQ
ncbi:Methyltransferase FkbM [Rhodopseudomonas palustris BisB18]|uniref:Methyltransferase FkbM n=1 Tax=Rhodopseudomonas palustris (strain BisB18) TaxID=316056 RepID=Q215H9_RHOPB